MRRHLPAALGPSLLGTAFLVATATALSACQQDEQDRVLYHEPGVYQGASDEGLSESTVEQLQRRARNQGV